MNNKDRVSWEKLFNDEAQSQNESMLGWDNNINSMLENQICNGQMFSARMSC